MSPASREEIAAAVEETRRHIDSRPARERRAPGVVYPLGYLMHCDPDRQFPEAP